MKLKSLFLLLTVLLSFGLSAQIDSTILVPDLLNPSHFPQKDKTTQNDQIITLYGEPIPVEQLSCPAYVITKEEILQNGYVTLTDALRMVPGIFVSPLGSATEGELFMMQGLRGNRMAQILINGVSIRPELAAGTPLAGQMPIRQAERIEIIMGPGMASVGFGASAGIINIVLKDSERPIYTQADLNIGGLGYNNIDVMFGGKLGRGKRILKFSAWGASTTQEDWDIGYPDEQSDGLPFVFTPSQYNHYYQQPRYLTNPNYSGPANFALKNNFPHESRQFGLSFRFGLYELIGSIHDRKDHSALGLNPLHVAYVNPVNFKAETISKVSFSKKAGNRKLKFSFNTSLQQLLTNQQSSAQYIESYLGNAYEQAILRHLTNPTIEQIDDIVNTNQAKHFSNERYFGSLQYDLNLGFSLSYPINSKYTLRLGQSNAISFGDTEKAYRVFPVSDRVLYDNIFTSSIESGFEDGGQAQNTQFINRTYVDNLINYTNLKLNIGFQVPIDRTVGVNREFVIFPRIGLNYQLNNRINLRSHYAVEGSHISDYLKEQTFAFDKLGLSNTLVTTRGIATQNAKWNEIVTTDFNIGIDVKIIDDLSIKLTGFANSTQNIPRLNTQIRANPLSTDSLLVVGFLNDTPYSNQMLGLRTQILYNKIAGITGLNLLFSGMIMKAEEVTIENGIDASFLDLADYPSLIMQWRLSYNSKSWYFGVENILQKETRSAAHAGIVTLGGLITDATIRYKLSRNFEIHTKAMNLFNTTYSGVSAVQYQDALLYNIQPLRRIRLGVTYRMQ